MNRKDFFRTLIGGAAVSTMGSIRVRAEENRDLELLNRYFSLIFQHPTLTVLFNGIYPKFDRKTFKDLDQYRADKMNDTCKFIQYAGIDAGRKSVNDLKLSVQTVRGREWSILTWDCGTAILHLDPKYI